MQSFWMFAVRIMAVIFLAAGLIGTLVGWVGGAYNILGVLLFGFIIFFTFAVIMMLVGIAEDISATRRIQYELMQRTARDTPPDITCAKCGGTYAWDHNSCPHCAHRP
ncbi:MAG: hypothetical protein FWB88_10255 [Defluviitaleaceae bacterium]|nr:hypothetical protein [Defluviitaleaceae bacterium]MCL2204305.1 hypothetical protein [Defluviitaleaceae bacterium]MCL2240481.1 hypothetical protein [Defluviitaleaceae bacterium]